MNKVKLQVLILVIIVSASMPLYGEETSENSAEEVVKEDRAWIDGRFSIDADAAWSDDASDIDLDQMLRLKISPPKHPKLRIYSSIWLHEDLDGDESHDSSLYDIDNAYDRDLRLKLSYLYLQAKDLWGKSELRVGRQRITESYLYPRIDGVFFEKNHAKWDWYLYLGARASLYENTQDEISSGLGVAWRPTAHTKLALDYAYMDEHRESEERGHRGFISRIFNRRYPYDVAEELDANYLALSLHQALGDNVWGYARLTLFDGNPNELMLDINGYAPGIDLTYTFSYRRQLDRVTDQASTLGTFYRTLGAQETYNHFLISLHKPISEKVALALETELHQSSGDKRYDNNRDYWRVAGMLMLSDLRPDLDITLSLERWDTERDSGSWVVTGEVSKQWDKWTWKVGANYEQYRDEIYEYNPYPRWLNQLAIFFVPGVYSRPITPFIWANDVKQVRTREEIHSLYTDLEFAFRENQTLSAKISFEEDDSDESPYWRLGLSYAIDF